jgi:predicted transcriptional regulator
MQTRTEEILNCLIKRGEMDIASLASETGREHIVTSFVLAELEKSSLVRRLDGTIPVQFEITPDGRAFMSNGSRMPDQPSGWVEKLLGMVKR